MKLTIS